MYFFFHFFFHFFFLFFFTASIVIDFRIFHGRWKEAVKSASALAKLCDARGMAPQYARVLLELSRARLGAEPLSPVGALPYALRCLAVCDSYSLDAIHATAMTHLAEVGLFLL